MFKIESNVAIPKNIRTRSSKYPIGELDINQSFSVPVKLGFDTDLISIISDETESERKTRQGKIKASLASGASRIAKEISGKFIVRDNMMNVPIMKNGKDDDGNVVTVQATGKDGESLFDSLSCVTVWRIEKSIATPAQDSKPGTVVNNRKDNGKQGKKVA